MTDHNSDQMPSFVRTLPAGGVEVEPLELDSDTTADLNRRLDEIRDARDRAAVSARSYIVHSSTTTAPEAIHD